MKVPKNKTYTAEDLLERLHTKYGTGWVSDKRDSKKYVLLEQVASGTGWANEGWVDAIVLGMWPSEGLTRRAFEIKVSRPDFLNELQNPKKNAWVREYCHTFWYVAPKDVIKEEELPEGDGWLCPHGDSLRIVRHAKRREVTLDDSFVASLARSLIKEQNKKVKEVAKVLRENDEDYLEALAYKNAARKFISEHHSMWHVDADDKEEVIYKLLNQASGSEKMAKEAKQMEYNMRSFQEKMLKLWDAMTLMAFVGITEVDEQGKFLIKYLEDDDVHLLALRRARDRKWYKKLGYSARRMKKEDKKLRSSWDVMVTRAKALIEGMK